MALVAALAQGGSLDRLAATRLRFTWLVFVGLVTQLGAVALSPRWLDVEAAVGALIAANSLIVVFLAANVRLPGMALAALGMLMNVSVIAANGAMPVLPRAASSAGVPISAENAGLRHEILDDRTKLPWLADAIPAPPLRTVLSLGDVLLALSLALFVYRSTLRRPSRRSRSKGASGSAPAAEP